MNYVIMVNQFQGQSKLHVSLFQVVVRLNKSNLNKYIACTLKLMLKDENDTVKKFTMFSNYIENVPVEVDEIMLSSDTNISIVDTLNIFKNYVNNVISLIEKHLIFQQPPSTRLILRFTKKLVLLQWKGQYLLPKQTLHKNEEILNGKLHFLCSEICLYAGS